MRTLILADASLARREQPLLSRLEIGLAAEGVRVVRAIPGSLLGTISEGVHTPVIGFEDSGSRLTRRGRARRLAALAAAAFDIGPQSEGPWLDVVHCFGYSACDLAMEVARQTGAGVAVEVWSGEVIGRARELSVLRAGRGGEPPVVLLAADDAVATALGATDAAASGDAAVGPVQRAPWGAHLTARIRPPIDPAGPVSIAVLADGADVRSNLALLEAIGDLAAHYPELLAFFDAEMAGRFGGGRAVWRRARQLQILDRLSMVGSLEEYREPILHVDLMIQPEAVGAHHSLTLDAMAAGVIVVARADPLVDHLIDGRTAVLVRSPSPADWAAAIDGIIRDPDRAHRLRESAREYIRTQRSPSRHIEAVLRGYERLAGSRAAV